MTLTRKLSSGVQVVVMISVGMLIAGLDEARADETVNMESLLREMVDLENLARRPEPFFKQAMASSYSRESHKGGDAWFHNLDRGGVCAHGDERRPHRARARRSRGPRRGHAVLVGQSHQDQRRAVLLRRRDFAAIRATTRGAVPRYELRRSGRTSPTSAGRAVTLYYPFPYADSLKITIEEEDEPLSLYYEIGYRTYESGARVETFDPGNSSRWEELQIQTSASARPSECNAGSRVAPPG